jgi:hypothetical protein
MLAATFISIFIIPACFYLVEKYFVGPRQEALPESDGSSAEKA